MSSSTENLNKVLDQLRRIVVLFIGDAKCTFSDFFDASRRGILAESYEYYSRFEIMHEDQVFKVYDYLCRRLPGLSSFILTSDECLFDDEFIQANELENGCILPGMDFRYFFRAQGVTPQIKEAIWTYIQSFLMLTLNDCNPFRKESNERLQRFLQGEGTDEESLNEFMQLFEDMDENSEQNFENVTAKLNAFFEQKMGGVGGDDDEDDDNAMDDADDAPSSSSGTSAGASTPPPPFFEPDKAKSFMENMSSSKIGRVAQEVMEDFKREHPALLSEFEQIVASAYENSQMKPLSLLKFIMSKGVSLRTLVKLLMDKLKEKIHKGELSMQDFEKDMPNFMPDFQNFSKSDLKSMMEQTGIKIPKGAQFNLNMERLRRQQEAEKTMQRMRDRLERQKKQAQTAMNLATASVSGFSTEDARLWAANAHQMKQNAPTVQPQWDKQRAEIEQLFQNNDGIVDHRGNVQRSGKHKKKR